MDKPDPAPRERRRFRYASPSPKRRFSSDDGGFSFRIDRSVTRRVVSSKRTENESAAIRHRHVPAADVGSADKTVAAHPFAPDSIVTGADGPGMRAGESANVSPPVARETRRSGSKLRAKPGRTRGCCT